MFTLADAGLAQVAKPVVARTKDVLRKRNQRALARIQREHERKIAQADALATAKAQARQDACVITCADGRVIKPIR